MENDNAEVLVHKSLVPYTWYKHFMQDSFGINKNSFDIITTQSLRANYMELMHQK